MYIHVIRATMSAYNNYTLYLYVCIYIVRVFLFGPKGSRMDLLFAPSHIYMCRTMIRSRNLGSTKMCLSYKTRTIPPRKTHTIPPRKTHILPPRKTHTLPPRKTHTIPPRKTHTLPPRKTHTLPPRKTHTITPRCHKTTASLPTTIETLSLLPL